MATFTEYIDVLEALASAPGGLTAGMVSRQQDCTMDTQKITRILKALEREGMVWSSRVAYRPNVLKVVWRIRSVAVARCSAVRSEYDENEGIRPPEPMTAVEYSKQQLSFKAALAAKHDTYDAIDEKFHDFYGGDRT